MNSSQHLGQRDARKLFLARQGLLRQDSFGRGRPALDRMLQRLSHLQIDTISVVDRAHEHIAASRVSNFEPRHLDQLVRSRRIFEYWSHAASFLPFENYRFSLPVMHGWRASRDHDRKLARRITDRIRSEGPLQSRDFEDSRSNPTSGWWDWKPAKRVLEHLFLSGELMVTERAGFQKVFDLPERVIPDHVDTSHPTEDEWADTLIRQQVQALGVATAYDIGYARATIRRLSGINLGPHLKAGIDRQVEAGELVPVSIEGQPYYTTEAILDQLPLRTNRSSVKILSPFDNLVINRRRTNALFDFDYLLECYVPAPKRKFGYFSLPLLLGDALIGRMDTKADRKAGILIIRNLVLEPGVMPDDALLIPLARGIHDFAGRHGTPEVQVAKTTPQQLKQALIRQLETP